jgi:hypothetical protein
MTTASERDIALLAGALALDSRTTRRLERHAQRVFAQVAKYRSTGGTVQSADQVSCVEFERQSSAYKSHDAHWLPGLLQTADYAAGVFASLSGCRPEFRDLRFVSNNIEIRQTRQKLLSQSNRQFQFTIDQSVVEHQLATMRDPAPQRARLLEATEMPNVDLAIVPTQSAVTTDTVLRFDNTLVLETYFRALVFDSTAPECSGYDQLFDSIDGALLRGDAAREIIRNAAS